MGETVTFGPHTFDFASGTLSRDGATVNIGTRGAALLGALIKANGATVSKDLLIDAAWPGLAVEEGNLSVQIAALRKALRPSGEGQEWIVTVPRLGYRLLRAEPSPPSSREKGLRLPVIAVLPFVNLSDDAAQDYFADGVVDDIITALSRFKSFSVIARNSSFVYKGRAVDVRQAAEDLGVHYVLEGSVRRLGERLRIAAQLVDGTTGTHLWARTFDGETSDVFDFQDGITESVVAIVEPHIREAEIARSLRDRPGSLEAYDLYLRAIPLHANMSPEGNAKGIELIEGALSLAPYYAAALRLAADLYSHRVGMGWPTITLDDKARCIQLTHLALASAPGDAPVLAQSAVVFVLVSHEYERGVLTIDRALEANPNNVDVLICAAVVHLHCGDVASALTYSQHALRLAPGDPTLYFPLTAIAHAQMVLGDYAEALAWAMRSYALNPNFDPTYWMLIAANALLGRTELARRHLQAFMELTPGITIHRIRDAQPSRFPDRMASILSGLAVAGLPED